MGHLNQQHDADASDDADAAVKIGRRRARYAGACGPVIARKACSMVAAPGSATRLAGVVSASTLPRCSTITRSASGHLVAQMRRPQHRDGALGAHAQNAA